jgi:hypothetical protein
MNSKDKEIDHLSMGGAKIIGDHFK